MEIFRRSATVGTILLFFLAGCGGGGNSGVVAPTPVDSTAPTATITFPTANSLTDGNTVTVHGTASDASQITRIQVNSVDATSSDGFANWQASVPLQAGLNPLQVATSDAASNNNSSAAQAIIISDTLLVFPAHIVLDAANNRALFADPELVAVIAVDLSTGVRTVLSSNLIPDSSNPFISPLALALDSANGRVLVADINLAAVIAVA